MTESSLLRLLSIMTALRDPKTGCPWDIEQDFASIAPCTIEEAYEVADAIQRGDMLHLKEELGDLLLQVVFHSQMAQEKGLFDFNAVAQAIADKLVVRHPHVFGDAQISTAAAQTEAWEAQKAEERKAKGNTSALDGVTAGLPAMTRAVKLQKRAARVGFDWPDAEGVFEKLDEEIAELRAARRDGKVEHVREELGDVLFTLINLARKLDMDPEEVLRAANAKFTMRFQRMEATLQKEKRDADGIPLEAWEELWRKAKTA
ncbi:MAG: nucleoside triphosphate pyrophosphohydrolase [Alphaproteobacteria bacterium]|nr:nucleoside triphosphate pyrophosphohydrolase [Alphaproteobacteria bacterium]